MKLVLILFIVSIPIELAIVINTKLYKRYITDGICILLGALGLYTALQAVNIAGGLFLLLMIYRAVNLARLTHRDLQEDYVYHLAIRASVVLILLQVIITVFQVIYKSWLNDAVQRYGYIGAICSLLLVAAILAQTVRHNKRSTHIETVIDHEADESLPTVTVLVPARNEDADLQACLETLVASTYPKLEIIVLDDCSQNAHTPDVIRSFAHDGVRFIAGTQPSLHWLAKNHAYNQLLQQSNSELVLFCGVDIRFEPTSITDMVQTMLNRKKTMMSVLPRNLVPSRFKIEACLVQPGRYAWELMLPRKLVDRPPVLSSCWIATKDLLLSAGGIQAVSRAINPERYFARYAACHNDSYSFVQSGNTLGIASVKSFTEQRYTAVRLRYPSLHRRIELTALTSLAELLILVSPYYLLIKAYTSSNFIGLSILSATVLLLTYSYTTVCSITYGRQFWRGSWTLPFAVIYDIALLHVSMCKYEFSQVLWKGRNVCIPVMRVMPHLPRIEDTPENHRGFRNGHNRHGRHHRRHHRKLTI